MSESLVNKVLLLCELTRRGLRVLTRHDLFGDKLHRNWATEPTLSGGRLFARTVNVDTNPRLRERLGPSTDRLICSDLGAKSTR